MIRTDLDNSGPNRTISECSGPKWTICATFGDARGTTGNEKRRRTTKDEKERQEWARGERWAGFAAGFAGYWNIKGCARMVRDLSDNFRAASAICGGGFSAIAPQMRHRKKEDGSHEKTPH
jgi:hypothetical protein